jgi:hypothetical protein
MTIVRIAHAEPGQGSWSTADSRPWAGWGATVTFSGEIRTEPRTEQAGLRLEILRHWWRNGRPREDHGITLAGGRPNWPGYEVTALIPDDADIIRFGIILTGTGSIALRNPELRIAVPARGA